MKQSCWLGHGRAEGSSCQHAMPLLVPCTLPPALTLPARCCEPADAPEISAKLGPLAARDLCCHCPSLPCYATGKRATTSLSEITQIPSELPAFVLGFACSVSEPSGLAQLTDPKCCSKLHQVGGGFWY